MSKALTVMVILAAISVAVAAVWVAYDTGLLGQTGCKRGGEFCTWD